MKESIIIKNGTLVLDTGSQRTDILVRNGVVDEVAPEINCVEADTFDASGCVVTPALADVHVHFRVPGNPDKETIATGTASAAAGGYTCVCTMPNLNPSPDSPETMAVQRKLIDTEAVIDVRPFSTITKGRAGAECVDYVEMLPLSVGFSDDGCGVQSDSVMENAMAQVAAIGGIISAHCEDTRFGTGPESEWKQIERDLKLAARTGCRYHVCHISTKESVQLIRDAKKSGVSVTCETAPHYLTLCDSDCEDDGRFKMNPPIRTAQDRDALIDGILDGTVDVIATDHAPHTAEEKSRRFAGSLNGILGLETAFPVVFTKLVKNGIITAEKLVDLMSVNPRRIFNLGGLFMAGNPAEIAVFNVKDVYTINSSNFASKGRSTPFEGWEVTGRPVLTLHNGKIVYRY